jgi:hypothetical protein
MGIEKESIATMSTKRGTHPNSRANLEPGSEPRFGEHKKVHQVTVTPTGWEGLAALAKGSGYKSVSELLERLGREGVSALAQNDVV